MREQRVQGFVTDEPEEVARGATDDAAALMRSDKPGVRVYADRAAWEGVAPAS